ncbi:outer membrane protein assembly factor BamB [Pontibacter ummariensis]|uniref:Outer membrane protein assembly factor BamB, contains PQQ-like beta-propeller repeat n=1 Tax=Pontibacter ummariensis TaxID=1610492 RepID=A0A239G3R0_9BACT|nr:PQQ-binding-like beta-propeller repeat protein [Pontibacter ummariensis]PRY11696.1 outer membrane protein assembly factor BamB [Pontibacter ummariensis]SNS62674.1 Outer membrane protein assembly factor BamB, contains PQQ-like beta-propeller repeat [Pontibacter ummariensis]
MRKVKHSLLLLVCLVSLPFLGRAQKFSFAFVTDIHIGNPTAAEDLQRTVQDINADSTLRFAVLTGDITEFGSDEELAQAKQIIQDLNKPWYIIAGNHDSNWSESGSNSFRRVFGAETFAFTYNGYLFAGTSSGPNMRMGPGQVPRENMVWLDSVLANMPDPSMPIIYLNHYPQDSSQNNWYEAIDRLKQRNIQLILCGHGHSNRLYNFDGIPSIIGRSNLRAKDSVGGYNIVTVENNTATFAVRKPLVETLPAWQEVPLVNHHFAQETKKYHRPSFSVNQKYAQVEVVWEYQDDSDVGAGTAVSGKLIFATNTQGEIYALNKKNGKREWTYQTGGKIYSTPAVAKGYVVVGSSDNSVYCLKASTGKQVWKVTTERPVLGSPTIQNKVVYVGGSDGHFRALDLKSGEVKWDFDQVKSFVVTKPLLYQGKVYFGSWGTEFYALDAQTGQLAWKWNNGAASRMYSPAACYPVATNGRVFIVAPDRYMTSFDANTGEVIWRKRLDDKRVRESMGLSADSSLVYVKTMDGELYGVSTSADSMQLDWKSNLQLPYELAPSAIVESKGVVYVPSHSGLASAVDRKTGAVLWQHKISNSLMNPAMPLGKDRVVVSTMDGKIACLRYKPRKK